MVVPPADLAPLAARSIVPPIPPLTRMQPFSAIRRPISSASSRPFGVVWSRSPPITDIYMGC